MQRNTIYSLLLIPLLFCSACRHRMHHRSNGPVVHELRTTGSFKGIQSAAGVEVYVRQKDSAERVEVVTNQNLLPDLKTEVEDGVLKIYMKNHNGFNWGDDMFRNKVTKVYVSARIIESLHSSSGSGIYGQTRINAPSLDLSSSAGSSLDVEINSHNLNSQANSGSETKIKGIAHLVHADVSSGANIQARELATDSSTLSASSGGSIHMQVSKSLVASASSGGNISYKGRPGNVSKDKSSGGDIEGEE